ncbi:MAG: hypothetical protein AAGF96_18910 [Bacteroidota bacterium]
MNELPIANDMSYWKTGKSGVETWLDRTEKLIESVNGDIHSRIIGKNQGKEAIMFAFSIGKDYFRMFWPVLKPIHDKDKVAAQRQASTMIYHDVKSRINRIRIFGPRVAFSDYLLLGDKTIAESQGDHSTIGKFLRLE